MVFLNLLRLRVFTRLILFSAISINNQKANTKFEYLVCRFCKNVEVCSVLSLRSIFSTDTNWHCEKVTLKEGPPRGERVRACTGDLMTGDIVTQFPLMALVLNLPTLL